MALLVIMASPFGTVSGINGSLSSLQSAIRQRKMGMTLCGSKIVITGVAAKVEAKTAEAF